MRYHTDISLEVLRKSTRNFNQDSRCPGRDSNRLTPDYNCRVLFLHQPIRFITETMIGGKIKILLGLVAFIRKRFHVKAVLRETQ